MSEIFGAALMGGGSGPAYAAISVTYPAGATCTCALGSKILTAPDTSGQALFIVPTAGEWIITANQGSSTKSLTVNVTEPTVYTAQLFFAEYLYKDGNTFETETGAWAINRWYDVANSFQANYQASYIAIVATASSGSYSGAGFWYKNLDVTNFNELGVTVIGGTGSGFFVNLSDQPKSSGNANYLAHTEINAGSGIFLLDISDFSGDYYIGVTSYVGSGSKNIEISEVFLR